MDAFGVLIVNESSHLISFKKEDFILIQSGEVRYPVSDTQVYAHLGSGYKPAMPTELSADVFQWRRSVNMRKSHGLETMSDNRLSVMGGAREKLFLFFKTSDSIAPVQFITIIYNEATKQRTRFSFKFIIEKK